MKTKLLKKATAGQVWEIGKDGNPLDVKFIGIYTKVLVLTYVGNHVVYVPLVLHDKYNFKQYGGILISGRYHYPAIDKISTFEDDKLLRYLGNISNNDILSVINMIKDYVDNKIIYSRKSNRYLYRIDLPELEEELRKVEEENEKNSKRLASSIADIFPKELTESLSEDEEEDPVEEEIPVVEVPVEVLPQTPVITPDQQVNIPVQVKEEERECKQFFIFNYSTNRKMKTCLEDLSTEEIKTIVGLRPKDIASRYQTSLIKAREIQEDAIKIFKLISDEEKYLEHDKKFIIDSNNSVAEISNHYKITPNEVLELKKKFKEEEPKEKKDVESESNIKYGVNSHYTDEEREWIANAGLEDIAEKYNVCRSTGYAIRKKIRQHPDFSDRFTSENNKVRIALSEYTEEEIQFMANITVLKEIMDRFNVNESRASILRKQSMDALGIEKSLLKDNRRCIDKYSDEEKEFILTRPTKEVAERFAISESRVYRTRTSLLTQKEKTTKNIYSEEDKDFIINSTLIECASKYNIGVAQISRLKKKFKDERGIE